MYATLFLIAAVVFTLGYIFYGRFMSKLYGLDNTRKVPSEELFDGVDYCPAHPAVLVGHHFASIAGAGPIVGPIAAAALFGWLPAFLWCLIGSVFFGGPHDMGTIVGSIRHEGKSMGEVVRRWIGGRAKVLYLSFTWLTLVLVVAVFLELSAGTLAKDPAVAFSGVLYMAMAVVFGVAIYRLRVPLWVMTIVMLPIVLGAVWYGSAAEWVQSVFNLDVNTWRLILTGYIFVASVLPVWLLLQPRDYLASYLLYFSLIIGGIGMLFGGGRFAMNLPTFTAFNGGAGQYLWPMLFVTIACGAISGFHSMVASGTTSKQLKKETDAVLVGYGSMLIEGLLAVIALGTIMMSGKILEGGPVATFGAGFGRFAELLGIDHKVGMSLGLLAINSFLLTTLDTATRLSRYQLQELSNSKLDRYSATAIGVAGALALLYIRSGDVPTWKIIWPLFGSANQLVAALALLGLAVWVTKGLKKKATFLLVPMVFMFVTTIAALVLLIQANTQGETHSYPVAVVAVVLLILAALLVKEAIGAFRRKDAPASAPEKPAK
ncbi:MAG TPA: carbon starvation protein A [Candidatus Hydrogenedentes bacterium]|nr:carbon starvation protein A [Candidatus Hydrogenedentota bacterium]HPG65507.1 carbon starvation protein A [Candidatus Hydrogenedentota bacterium]